MHSAQYILWSKIISPAVCRQAFFHEVLSFHHSNLCLQRLEITTLDKVDSFVLRQLPDGQVIFLLYRSLRSMLDKLVPIYHQDPSNVFWIKYLLMI